MDNFDAHKWFKKEYLGEGHTEDKTKEINRARIEAFLKQNPNYEKDSKTAEKIRAMLAKEKEEEELRDYYKGDSDVLPADLKEDNLNEISRDTYDRMESLANQRELNELKDLIMILGGEWANEGFENKDIADYFEVLVGQLVRM